MLLALGYVLAHMHTVSLRLVIIDLFNLSSADGGTGGVFVTRHEGQTAWPLPRMLQWTFGLHKGNKKQQQRVRGQSVSD